MSSSSFLHTCTTCTKSFSTIGNLNKHQRSAHNYVKNNICACSRIFNSALSLNAHVRWCLVHRQGRPIKGSGFKGKTSPHKNKKLEDIVSDANATRRKLQIAAKKRQSPTEEQKRKMSKARINYLERNPHLHWYEVDGVKVQGTWERDVAEELKKRKFRFSRPRLLYDTHRTYTPDFFVHDLNIYIEVKGWMREHDKIKYKQVLIDQKIDLRILAKKHMDAFLNKKLDVLELPKMIDSLGI